MANILTVTGGATSLIPTTSWAAPNGLFPTTSRNDSTLYGWNSATSTLTLPAAAEGDGYLITWGYELTDTSNGRTMVSGRVIQSSGTGTFASATAGGYTRDTTQDQAYASGWAFVDNPSASAEFQFQFRRDTDAPTGGTSRAFLQVVPFSYSDIGIYTSTSSTIPGGTTPTQITGFSGTDGTNITIASDTVTVTGDNKRYLALGSVSAELNTSTRTQRWTGFREDGVKDDSAKACTYYRQASCDTSGSSFVGLYETTTASKTLDIFCYRGDGVAAGQGGADVDGATVATSGAHTMVVIELNDSAEVFHSEDSTAEQALTTANTDLTISATSDIAFNDSASFVRSTDTAVDIVQNMDALLIANVSQARETSISSGTRWEGEGSFTITGTTQTDVGFHGNFNRGNQGSADTHGSSYNSLGAYALTSTDTVGYRHVRSSTTQNVTTQPGWVGFSALNLDTLASSTTPVSNNLELEYQANGTTPVSNNLELEYQANDTTVAMFAVTINAGVTAVSNTLDTSYDSLTDVAQTVQVQFNSVESVTQSLTLTYSALESVTQTQSLSYEALSSVSQTQSLSYEALSSVSQTQSLSYEALSSVSQTQDVGYESVTSVSQTLSAGYDALGSAVQTLSTSYEAIGSVSQALTSSYDALVTVSQTLPSSYDALDSVVQTLSTSYEATGSVSQTLSAGYDALGSVSQTLSLGYESVSAVTRTSQVQYESVQTVSGDITLVMGYEVENQVSRNLGTSYTLLNSVDQDLTFSYNGNAALTSVDNSLAVGYSSLEDLAQSVSVSYESVSEVVATVTPSYSLISSTSSNLSTQYNAVVSLSAALTIEYSGSESVSSTLATSYSSLNSVEGSVSSSYDSLIRVAGSQVTTYNAEGAVGVLSNSLNISYDHATAVTATLTAQYETISKASAPLPVSYSVETRVSSSLSAGYATLTNLSAALGTSYNSVSVVTGSVSVSQDIENSLTSGLTTSYNLNGSVTQGFEIGYSVQSDGQAADPEVFTVPAESRGFVVESDSRLFQVGTTESLRGFIVESEARSFIPQPDTRGFVVSPIN